MLINTSHDSRPCFLVLPKTAWLTQMTRKMQAVCKTMSLFTCRLNLNLIKWAYKSLNRDWRQLAYNLFYEKKNAPYFFGWIRGVERNIRKLNKCMTTYPFFVISVIMLCSRHNTNPSTRRYVLITIAPQKLCWIFKIQVLLHVRNIVCAVLKIARIPLKLQPEKAEIKVLIKKVFSFCPMLKVIFDGDLMRRLATNESLTINVDQSAKQAKK